MKDQRWTIYIPVLIVILLSVPVVYISNWTDFRYSRELAEDVSDSDGLFAGFNEKTSTTIDLVPDSVVDRAIEDADENITYTDREGNQQNVTQSSGRKTLIGSVLDALLMVGISIGAAFLIFFLFKMKRKVTLKAFFAVALGLCASVSVMFYLFLLRYFLNQGLGLGIEEGSLFYWSIVLIGLAVGIAIVYNMVFRSMDRRRKNTALIAFCVIMGPFLTIVLPVWVIVFLLTGIALWDLWAAKRGVIKDMVNLSDEHRKEESRPGNTAHLRKSSDASHGTRPQAVPGRAPSRPVKRKKKNRGLFDIKAGEDITSYGLYEGKHFSLGIGDFIFFSVLVTATFKWMMLKVPWMGFYEFGYGELLAVSITMLVAASVILGLKKTLSYLERENVMPGLPLSVLYGLVALISSFIFLEIINWIGYGQPVNPF